MEEQGMRITVVGAVLVAVVLIGVVLLIQYLTASSNPGGPTPETDLVVL